MTIWKGFLHKMQVSHEKPVQYRLFSAETQQTLLVNDLLGKKIYLTFTNSMQCIQCKRAIKKSFQQGFCFPCLQRLQECDLCIIHPERCHVEKGNCSVTDWAHAHCNQSHIIYLANSSGLKIGITRETQMPTRWIDQGAKEALPIFRVENRYRAGEIEVRLKQFFKDKTNWRVMLKNEVPSLDLKAAKKTLLANFEKNPFDILTEDPLEFFYPILHYPKKITALSFDKTPSITGELWGIKGQYLILDTGVLNIRKFAGYEVNITVE